MKNILILLTFLVHQYVVNANIIVLNGLTHKYKTEKGHTYRGKIQLQNMGKETASAKLYLQDITYNAEGSTYYSEPGTNNQSLSSWLKFNTNYVQIPPGEKTEILYEISVPDGVTEHGSYWATCMIEPVEEISPTKNNTGIQIRTVIRYAIHIIADYTTESTPTELVFRDIIIENNNNIKHLKINVANTGRVFCEAIVSLEVFNSQNNKKIDSNFTSTKMGILPNTSKNFVIDISSLEKGKYKVIGFIKDDQDNVFALEFALDVE